MTLVLDFSMQQIDNHAIGLLKILHPVTKIPTSVSKEIQVVKLVACQAKSTTNIQAIYLFPYSSNSMMEWYGVIIVLTSYVGRLLHHMQAIMHVAVFLM